MAQPRNVALGVLGLESRLRDGRTSPSSASRTSWATGWCADDQAQARRRTIIAEVGSLTQGDIVVHVDHGIGRFVGLKTIDAAGAPHDCLEIHYAGGDKLFLPVENIELLSRYGSEDTEVQLDRLGGGALAGAQGADEAAHPRDGGRADQDRGGACPARGAAGSTAGQGIYDEFCARFPYDETEDQQTAIDAVLDDLVAGRPMDRLICGDVGFGKTEVALRAAFAAALSGRQVAVVVPTTLLARQHLKTFSERFKGLPVRVAQVSRFVSAEATASDQGGACRRRRSTSSSEPMRCLEDRSPSGTSRS